MLFNNLIFSPLEGHKLLLRGGFWKIKSPSSVCIKFKQILNDKPPGFGPLSRSLPCVSHSSPRRLCLTTYNYIFGVTRLELCPRKTATEKIKWHTRTEMFLRGGIFIPDQRQLLVTILTHKGTFSNPSDAKLSWRALVKPWQLCVALTVTQSRRKLMVQSFNSHSKSKEGSHGSNSVYFAQLPSPLTF